MIWLLTQPPEKALTLRPPKQHRRRFFADRPFVGHLRQNWIDSLMRLRARQKEVSESEDQVDGKELQALEPVGSSVTRNLGRD